MHWQLQSSAFKSNLLEDAPQAEGWLVHARHWSHWSHAKKLNFLNRIEPRQSDFSVAQHHRASWTVLVIRHDEFSRTAAAQSGGSRSHRLSKSTVSAPSIFSGITSTIQTTVYPSKSQQSVCAINTSRFPEYSCFEIYEQCAKTIGTVFPRNISHIRHRRSLQNSWCR